MFARRIGWQEEVIRPMPVLFGKTKIFAGLLAGQKAAAQAQIKGSKAYASVHGKVLFFPARKGTLVMAEVFGLPQQPECDPGFFALHIHEGSQCTGTSADPFANVGGHWNPGNCPHPAHAGDLPPLLSNAGYAWFACYTERFEPEQVIGRTVIVHRKPDYFTTQPSGNSGEKIACGQIREVRK